MRRLVAFIAIAWLGLVSPAIAQVSAGSLEKRLKSVDPEALTDADCASEVAKAANSNGLDLIYGGRVCESVGEFEESTLLFAVGQIRAGTDVLLLPPATRADDQSLMGLYGMLYFGGGVAGIKDEVLREARTREKFLNSFEKWTPTYSLTYDPGWKARKRPDAAKYQATIADGKAGLRKYLERAIRLVSGDQYYALHRQYMQLLEQNPNGIQADTPQGKLLAELQERKRKRVVALGMEVGPSPSELIEEAEEKDSVAEMRENFPPYSPAKDERILISGAEPIAERCLDLAERHAVSQGSKIVRVLITSSEKWGTIWRADIAGGDSAATRFTCTETTSSSSPMDLGPEPILPLPVKSGERQKQQQLP